MGQPVLASIRNSEWPHFRVSLTSIASNSCQLSQMAGIYIIIYIYIYGGGRTLESRNSESTVINRKELSVLEFNRGLAPAVLRFQQETHNDILWHIVIVHEAQ